MSGESEGALRREGVLQQVRQKPRPPAGHAGGRPAAAARPPRTERPVDRSALAQSVRVKGRRCLLREGGGLECCARSWHGSCIRSWPAESERRSGGWSDWVDAGWGLSRSISWTSQRPPQRIRQLDDRSRSPGVTSSRGPAASGRCCRAWPTAASCCGMLATPFRWWACPGDDARAEGSDDRAGGIRGDGGSARRNSAGGGLGPVSYAVRGGADPHKFVPEPRRATRRARGVWTRRLPPRT